MASSFGKNGGEALGKNVKPSTGASFKQTGAATPTTQTGAARNPAPAAPAAPAAPGTHPVTTVTPATPFATPEQTQSYLTAMAGFAQQIADLGGQLTQAPIDERNAEGQNIHDSAVTKQQTDALAAARGQFGSGVNQSDLTDIAAKLTLANTTLQNNLTSLQTSLNGKIAAINGPGGLEQIEQNTYDQQKVDNAQGVDPTTTTTQVPNAPAAAPAPAPAGPTPTGPPTTQPQTTHTAVSQPSATSTGHTTGAALTTPSQKPPPQARRGQASGSITFPRGMGAF